MPKRHFSNNELSELDEFILTESAKEVDKLHF